MAVVHSADLQQRLASSFSMIDDPFIFGSVLVCATSLHSDPGGRGWHLLLQD